MDDDEFQRRKQHFAMLKSQYKATQFEDSSPLNHLYNVLKKIETEEQLLKSDITFLKRRGLTESLKIAIDQYVVVFKEKIEAGQRLPFSDIAWLKRNGCEDILIQEQKNRFAILKSKYESSDYPYDSLSSPLYAILQKLEKKLRLEPAELAWLKETKIQTRGGERRLFFSRILKTYHKIEAVFYEKEYKLTKNQWHLHTACIHWLSANKGRKIIKLTDKLNFIKESKLMSALLTLRGEAFRDIRDFEAAVQCVRQAIKFQPGNHQAYTLMSVLCYEQGDYSTGDSWFGEAMKRGASPEDLDTEIKRVLRKANKEKRRRIVDYLLKKDSARYQWAEPLPNQTRKEMAQTVAAVAETVQ